MPEIIVALDVPTVDEARALILELGLEQWYKIGLELAYAPDARSLVASLPNVFLDLKLNDIPTTIERACRQIAREWRPKMLSVSKNVEHALMGTSAFPEVQIIHVPNLTSDYQAEPVWSRAHGVVCRASFAPAYRRHMPWARIIVPGIRPPGASEDDHVETATSCEVANYLVIGRPITRAKNPLDALRFFEEGKFR